MPHRLGHFSQAFLDEDFSQLLIRNVVTKRRSDDADESFRRANQRLGFLLVESLHLSKVRFHLSQPGFRLLDFRLLLYRVRYQQLCLVLNETRISLHLPRSKMCRLGDGILG